jgi:hypothetical protein
MPEPLPPGSPTSKRDTASAAAGLKDIIAAVEEGSATFQKETSDPSAHARAVAGKTRLPIPVTATIGTSLAPAIGNIAAIECRQ